MIPSVLQDASAKLCEIDEVENSVESTAVQERPDAALHAIDA